MKIERIQIQCDHCFRINKPSVQKANDDVLRCKRCKRLLSEPKTRRILSLFFSKKLHQALSASIRLKEMVGIPGKKVLESEAMRWFKPRNAQQYAPDPS